MDALLILEQAAAQLMVSAVYQNLCLSIERRRTSLKKEGE